MSVKVSDNVVRYIISRHIQESVNKNAMVDCIINTMDSNALEMLVNISISEHEYTPFNINDVVMFKHDFNVNHLDHSICDGIASRFGIVTGSDNYGDTFNPYYYKLNIIMFDLDESNKLLMSPIDMYTNEISLVMPEKAEDLRQMYNSIK